MNIHTYIYIYIYIYITLSLSLYFSNSRPYGCPDLLTYTADDAGGLAGVLEPPGHAVVRLRAAPCVRKHETLDLVHVGCRRRADQLQVHRPPLLVRQHTHKLRFTAATPSKNWPEAPFQTQPQG